VTKEQFYQLQPRDKIQYGSKIFVIDRLPVDGRCDAHLESDPTYETFFDDENIAPLRLIPPPERGDIHDIIGYDESVLKEEEFESCWERIKPEIAAIAKKHGFGFTLPNPRWSRGKELCTLQSRRRGGKPYTLKIEFTGKEALKEVGIRIHPATGKDESLKGSDTFGTHLSAEDGFSRWSEMDEYPNNDFDLLQLFTRYLKLNPNSDSMSPEWLDQTELFARGSEAIREIVTKMSPAFERSDIHDILGYDESLVESPQILKWGRFGLSEWPIEVLADDGRKWVAFTPEELENLQPGDTVVIYDTENFIETQLQRRETPRKNFPYGVFYRKDSLYAHNGYRFGKWYVPERGEIHDIIGYDESVLKEGLTPEQFENLKVGDKVYSKEDSTEWTIVYKGQIRAGGKHYETYYTGEKQGDRGSISGTGGGTYSNKISTSLYPADAPFLRLAPPERGEIHDILGYDESVLEGTFPRELDEDGLSEDEFFKLKPGDKILFNDEYPWIVVELDATLGVVRVIADFDAEIGSNSSGTIKGKTRSSFSITDRHYITKLPSERSEIHDILGYDESLVESLQNPGIIESFLKIGISMREYRPLRRER
jgi:hypothetical protein